MIEHGTISRTEEQDRRLDELEVAMVSTGNLLEAKMRHIFAPGVYIREITIPAGAMLTSKIHKTTHPFIVSKGVISIWEENGNEIKIKAPFTGISKAGTRRVGYAHKETVWSTVHVTDISPEDFSDEAIQEAVARIEERVIDKRENTMLTDFINEVCEKYLSQVNDNQ